MTPHKKILGAIRRRPDSEEHEKIRKLWTAHSIAEDSRDIPGLMATLTEDCIYKMPQNGLAWEGHEGATRFYNELLTAFPDVHFDLQNIVIGPQGVFEEAHVTGTHEEEWHGFAPTGKPVEFDVLIFFPWDSAKEKFSGERVYYFGLGENA